MEQVYIVFRGDDQGEQELQSVHSGMLSARLAVDEIVRMCAAEGFIYELPEEVPGWVPPRTLRAWCCRDTYISIEKHDVVGL